MNPKVFLGGTYNSNWRYEFKFLAKDVIDYFDPVVDDWNDEAKKREEYEKEHSDFCLYTITPKMASVCSIAEIVDGSNKNPQKNILCFLFNDGGEEFTSSQWKSLKAVADIVENNGSWVCYSLFDVCANIVSLWEKMND